MALAASQKYQKFKECNLFCKESRISKNCNFFAQLVRKENIKIKYYGYSSFKLVIQIRKHISSQVQRQIY